MPELTDYFAAFDLPRRPWLDAEVLRSRFLELSTQAHPDRVHEGSDLEKAAANRRTIELNAAYRCLREPKDRLRHLLELESGAPPANIHEIPAGLAELFPEIARLCRDLDRFLAGKAKVTAPLLKVRWFQEGGAWHAQIDRWKQELAGRSDRLLAELELLNEAWESAPGVGSSSRQRALPLARLEEIYRALSFLGRWLAQLNEKSFQLAS